MDKFDVLVVGAGPTGLMMASELARYGLKCRIIERSEAKRDYSKALAIQPRTLEIFHLLGLSETFLKKGKRIGALNAMSGQDPLGRIDFSSLNSPFPFILSVPQTVTEEILERHLEGFGTKVERGVELVGLEERGEEVVAQLQSSEKGTEELIVRWIVGCDGAHSFVRKHLNLSFLGKSSPRVFSLADVEVAWRYSDEEAFAFFNTEGVLAAIPLPEKNRYRLIFLLDRCQSAKGAPVENFQVESPPPTMGEVERIVREHGDPKATVTNPRWLANFHVNSRLVKSYRLRNFFLAGDAAHIHSPIGGQGMNTGLQDAFNLAWKMAFVQQKRAPVKLLDTYQQERHAIAIRLLEGTEVGTLLATLRKKWEILLRNFIGSSLLHLPFLKRGLIRAVTQLGITYPKNRYLFEEGKFKGGPKVGTRAPDGVLRKGEKEVRLHDLFHKIDQFFLLLFLGDDDQWEKGEMEQLALPLEIIPISKRASSTTFFDEGGKLHAAFGVGKKGCYVVRPDTYIGYRQTPLHIEGLVAYFRRYSPAKLP